MKTTDPRDPLDQQIDALLTSRPLQPSDDFAKRVLTACNAEPAPTITTADKRPTLVRFALPIAAAIILAFTLAPQLKRQGVASSDTEIASSNNTAPKTTLAAPISDTQLPTIDEINAQEIFLIEESLTDLALNEEYTELGSGKLLATFDALLLEIQS